MSGETEHMDPTDSEYAHPTRSLESLDKGDPVVVVYGGRDAIHEFVQRGWFRWATKRFGPDYVQVRMGQPYRRAVLHVDRVAPAKTTEELGRERGSFDGELTRRGGFI